MDHKVLADMLLEAEALELEDAETLSDILVEAESELLILF